MVRRVSYNLLGKSNYGLEKKVINVKGMNNVWRGFPPELLLRVQDLSDKQTQGELRGVNQITLKNADLFYNKEEFRLHTIAASRGETDIHWSPMIFAKRLSDKDIIGLVKVAKPIWEQATESPLQTWDYKGLQYDIGDYLCNLVVTAWSKAEQATFRQGQILDYLPLQNVLKFVKTFAGDKLDYEVFLDVVFARLVEFHNRNERKKSKSDLIKLKSYVKNIAVGSSGGTKKQSKRSKSKSRNRKSRNRSRKSRNRSRNR